MSNIHIVPQAANQVKTMRVDARPSRFESPDLPPSHDQEMMHAWSMGVTDAVRERDQQASHEHEDACPPEVYIG